MSLFSLSQRLVRPRLLYLGVAVVCTGLIGFGIFLQEFDHLNPVRFAYCSATPSS
ncbi:MAG TPA: hypothetical protein VEE84_04800 [Burkholderiaceae bacterium]|nr:hypothetical protein [Burkholderiaceae bacterium]